MTVTTRGIVEEDLRPFLTGQIPPDAREIRVRVHELRGGLVADSVVQVLAEYVREDGRAGSTGFVLKRLNGIAVREARIYERLLAEAALGFSPLLYGVRAHASGATHLCLEAVTPVEPWPWADLSFASAVLEQIGRLHALPLSTQLALHAQDDWDYATELERAAAQTVDAVEGLCGAVTSPTIERSLAALRRIQRALPQIREELLAFPLLPPSVIHGDLHPGNVVVRRKDAAAEPILLDWARTRIGSPLEDVASWLQWLGFWEPEARRKHDTLLGAYLRARGLPRTPSRAVRRAYWLAGALNCYAGVMTYHAAVASETEADDPSHQRSLSAILDCLRVIRRADVYFRASHRTSRGRSR